MHKIYFIQRLRIALVALVIAHHAGQAYGPTGGFWPIHDATTGWLGPFFGLNAAYFMGLFFLIAGAFTPQSFDRKGAGRYARDRLVQLGLPAIVFAVLVLPLLAYGWQQPSQSFSAYWLDFFRHNGLQFAHLWFIAWLLVLSLAYAGWRLLPFGHGGAALPVPGGRGIAVYAVLLALANIAVRSVYDQDTWVTIAGLPIEPVHVPQYLSLFVVGLFAGRGRWLERLSGRILALWFGFAVCAIAVALAVEAVGLPPFVPEPVFVGAIEAVVCVGMIAGSIGLFRRFGSRPSRLASALDADSYAMYLVHWPLVIIVQGVLSGIAFGPTAKFAAATVVAWLLSLAVAEAWRRLKTLGRRLERPADAAIA